jgi:hypothetical protein
MLWAIHAIYNLWAGMNSGILQWGYPTKVQKQVGNIIEGVLLLIGNIIGEIEEIY